MRLYYHFWCIFGILFTKYQIDVKRIMFYLIFCYLPAVYFCISRFFAKLRISQFRVFSHLQNGAQDISRTVASIGLIFWHKIHHTLLLKMSHGISQKIWKKKLFNFFFRYPKEFFFKILNFQYFSEKLKYPLFHGSFWAEWWQESCVKKSAKSNKALLRYLEPRFLLT